MQFPWHPEKLKELQELFKKEAAKYNVYPLDDRFSERLQNPERPSVTRGRTEFNYKQSVGRIPEGSAPAAYGRSHTISIDFEMPQNGGDGVLVANGGTSGGYTIYIRGGKPVYEVNYFDKDFYKVVGDSVIKPGKVTLTMDYVQEGEAPNGGTATLKINGEQVGKGKIDKVPPKRYSATETLDIGKDLGSTVSEEYRQEAPYAFPGKIENVKIQLN